MADGRMISRRRFAVVGQVQGVGFRPFVYRLAAELGLSGFVVNDAGGVRIEVQGRPEPIETFERRLQTDLPPLGRIHRLTPAPIRPMTGEKHFEILASEAGQLADAQVTVDTAICPQCLAEMNDPGDPRHAYPFINCTNCGPRYTIVRRIPYDRANTTMADFGMCGLCSRQYADPADRRFHAEPIACPVCGPGVWLVGSDGRQIPCDDPIAEAWEMLRAGKIVAIKGLGGFHLACRADDDAAVRQLRERKRRDAKPFALMVGDLAEAGRLCKVSDEAAGLLAGPIRPVVLLPARPGGGGVSSRVAEGLDTLGIMLPYTPLHHLLFGRGLGPLVMTSGNFSEEPLIKDNEAAVSQLSVIADAIVLHNRRIERRVDDSVVQAGGDGSLRVVRRGRGYAPAPIHLPAAGGDRPAVLAVGAELKNTVCLLRGSRAVMGEHIGDLTDGRTYRHFIETIDHLERLFEISPDILAADLHPAYLSTEYARRRHRGDLPGCGELPIVHVQHHHAHVAACLAENGRDGPAIGLACDGVGYGDDGAVWGCEVLQVDMLDYRRLGHLRYMPLVGGDAAALETYRPALAVLYETFGQDCGGRIEVCLGSQARRKADAVLEMLALGVNCPPSSSLGRWFDAMACLVGVAEANRFEGEAPMRLEAVAEPGIEDAYAFGIHAAGPFEIDLRPTVEGVCEDLARGVSAGLISAKFHNTVVRFLLAAAARAREETHLDLVALSGGCFANRYVTVRLVAALEEAGFEVLAHREIPCNDGGVALGQAVVAAARHRAQLEKVGTRIADHPK